MKKILITGGCGFIGMHLIELLSLYSEYDLYLFDIQKRNDIDTMKFIKGDINNLRQLVEACSEMDGVIHLAALSRVSLAREMPYECIDLNVIGTLNILESIRLSQKRPWLIISSTREVNFDWEANDLKSDLREITNMYGISKFISELLCFRYAKDYSIRTIALRFSDVYGSAYDNPEKALPNIMSRSLDNKEIIITTPRQQFDFIYYKDAVEAVYLTMRYLWNSHSHTFRHFSICNGRVTTLAELAKLIVKETRSSSQIRFADNALNNNNSRLYNDTKNAQRVLGFKAKTSLEEGIRYTIQSFEAVRC